MSNYYQTTGITKQAFHQYIDRQLKQQDECEQLIPIIMDIRKEYPTTSAREMYRLINPVNIGRDRFEKFCFEMGFKLIREKSYHRTTNSLGVTRFDNLIEGLELKGINHVWVSDITYYRIREQFFYLTFITDKFSKRIVGYSVSHNLITENTTIPALIDALAKNGGVRPEIIHSDGGGQYYSKDFRALTGEEIKNSMGVSCYENPLAERINGIIKNDFLAYFGPQNFEQLVEQVERAVNNYNLKKQNDMSEPGSLMSTLSTNKQLLTKEKKKQKKKILQQLNKFV